MLCDDCSEAVRTEEGRQEFVTEKYIELKYTGEEERERIRGERQEARAESVRRSNKLVSQTSMFTSAPHDTNHVIYRWFS